MQPSLLDLAPPHDGPGLEPADHVRLGKQLAAVLAVMLDGEWHTLAEIAKRANAPEASVSARLRDLRKPKFGGYVVVPDREPGRGLHVYRLTR